MGRWERGLKRTVAWVLTATMVMGSLDAGAFVVSAEETMEIVDITGSEISETIGTTDGSFMNVGEQVVMVELPEEHYMPTERLSSNEWLSLLSLDESGNVALKSGNYANWIDRIDMSDVDYAIPLYNWLVANSNPETAINNPNAAALFDPVGNTTGEVIAQDTNQDEIIDTYIYPVAQLSGSATFDYTGNRETDLAAAYAAIQEEMTANTEKAYAYITGAYSALDRDHPEVFWLRGYPRMQAQRSYGYSGSTATYQGTVYITLKNSTYDIRADEYLDTETLRDAINETLVLDNSYKETILAGVPENADTYETVQYFNKWLTEHNCYNSDLENAGHDARECTSALKGSTGTIGPVCEAYARAFKVLCDAENIPCVLVDGTAISSGGSGGHMWNYVQMDDDNWYGVDVTWNDPTVSGVTSAVSGYESERYFLVGSDTVVGSMNFITSHPVSNTVMVNGTAFTNGPVLAEGEYVHTERHVHDITYTVNGGTVTAGCTGCEETGNITLVASGGIYNGSAYEADYEAPTGLLANETPVITYKKGNDLLESAPIEAGTYTASITVGGQTASVEYTISKATISHISISKFEGEVTQEVALKKIYDGTKLYDGPELLEIDLLDSSHQKVASVVSGDGSTVIIEYSSANAGCNEYQLSVTVSDALAANFTNATATFEETFQLSELIMACPIYVSAVDQLVPVNGMPDGSKVTVSGEYDMVAGHTVNAIFEEVDTSTAGEKVLIIQSVIITDAEGNDVTSNYAVTIDKAGVLTVKEHIHDWEYEVINHTITATCVSTFGICPDAEQSLSVIAPDGDLVYDGRVKLASVEGTIDGVDTPEIVYEGEKLVEGQPVNSGTYRASITIDNITATTQYTIGQAPKPDITWPVAGSLVYGQTLKESVLSGGSTDYGTFTWEDETILPDAGEQTYDVIFTPTELAVLNYKDMAVSRQSVAVKVDKANPAYTVPVNLEAQYGQKLSQVTLPQGWSWDEPEVSVGAVGSRSFAASYEPEDTDNYNTIHQNLSVKVTPIELTISKVTAESREYDGTTAVKITEIELVGALAEDEVYVDLEELTGSISSDVVGVYKSVELPILTLSGKEASNYTVKHPTGTITTDITISPRGAEITLEAATYEKVYGDAAFALNVSDNNPEADVVYTVTSGTDVISVTDGMVTIQKAGEATIVVSMEASANYNAAESKTITVKVNKKQADIVEVWSKEYLYIQENAERIQLKDFIPDDCGEIVYQPAVTSGSVTYQVAPTVTDGVLTYTLNSGEAGAEGTIQIVAVTDNYEDFAFTVNIKLVKQIPVVLKDNTAVVLENNELQYGEKLSQLKFKSDSAEFVRNDGTTVAGTLVWKDASLQPDVKVTEAEWVFTPDEEEYAAVSGTVAIVVKPAKLTVTEAVAEDRTHDGTDIVVISKVSLDGVVADDEVKVDVTALKGTLDSADAGEYTSVTLPALSLIGADKDNYILIQPEEAVPTQVTIFKAKAVIVPKYDSYKKIYNDEPFSIAGDIFIKGEGQLIYSVSDGLDADGNPKLAEEIVRVSEDGWVTVLRSGSVKLSLDMAETVNYQAAETKTITLQIMAWDDVSRNGFFVKSVNKEFYTGKAIKPEPEVYDGNAENRLVKGQDYTVSYKNNTKAYTLKEGDAGFDVKKAPVIIIKGKGNYNSTLKVYFTIQPMDISDEYDIRIVADDVVVEENGKIQKKTPVVKFNNKKLGKADVEISYPATETGAYKEPGSYPIVIKGKGNFTGSRTVDFIIAQKGTSLAKATIGKITAQEFDGVNPVELNETELVVSAKVNGKKETLKRNVHYTVEYANNKAIGTGTVIIRAVEGSGFAGFKKATFKITGVSIAKATVSGVENQVYTGNAQKLALKVSMGGVLVEGKDYTVSYVKNTNVGTATVTIKGMGKYTGSIKKSFKITAADITSLVKVKDGELTAKYVKGGAKPSLNLVFNGKVLNEGKDYTITYKNNKAVYTAKAGQSGYEVKKAPTIIIKGKGNFVGTVSRTFTIVSRGLLDEEAAVTMTVADKVVSSKKGGYISKVVITDADGKALKQGVDYSVPVYTMINEKGEAVTLTKEDIVPVGSVIMVAVSGMGAYAGKENETLTATYRITAMDFTKAKVQNIQKAYTGKKVELTAADFVNANGTSKVTIGGKNLVYGKDFEVVPGSYKNNQKKGTATVTIRGLGEYGGTKTVKFKIGARSLWFWWL